MKKKLSGGSKIILLLAILAALMAGYGMYNYLSVQYVNVFLYAQDYEEGASVDRDMFVQQKIPVSLYNNMLSTGNSYATSDELQEYITNGGKLLVNVAQYTPVTSNQFVAGGGTPTEFRLDDNRSGVELRADEVAGLSGEMRIGSRVNIMTSYDVDQTKITELIFQDVVVLDTVYDANEELVSVYVEIDPEESIKLVHALTFESVSVTINKPASYEAVPAENSKFERTYTVTEDNSSYTNTEVTEE